MPEEFEELAAGLGVGVAPAGWCCLAALPLTVLVGVTGVGKSTTIAALQRLDGAIRVLPNRRFLADRLVIPHVQRLSGAPLVPVTDRRRRFDLTRRYRELHPGGLAHALSRLVLDPAAWPRSLLFDGLRGADETAFAAATLPHARFVVLDAPDVVRVERLLRRNDAFDRVAGTASGATFRGEDAPDDGAALFTAAERARLAALVERGQVTADELRARIAIVAAERRNYDPMAAIATLRRLAPERTLVIDTIQHTPDATAEAIWEGMMG